MRKTFYTELLEAIPVTCGCLLVSPVGSSLPLGLTPETAVHVYLLGWSSL